MMSNKRYPSRHKRPKYDPKPESSDESCEGADSPVVNNLSMQLSQDQPVFPVALFNTTKVAKINASDNASCTSDNVHCKKCHEVVEDSDWRSTSVLCKQCLNKNDPLPMKFNCVFCKSIFVGLNSLVWHFGRYHRSFFMCKTCGKIFPDKELLKSHDHSAEIECRCDGIDCKICAAYVCRYCSSFFRCTEYGQFINHSKECNTSQNKIQFTQVKKSVGRPNKSVGRPAKKSVGRPPQYQKVTYSSNPYAQSMPIEVTPQCLKLEEEEHCDSSPNNGPLVDQASCDVGNSNLTNDNICEPLKIGSIFSCKLENSNASFPLPYIKDEPIDTQQLYFNKTQWNSATFDNDNYLNFEGTIKEESNCSNQVDYDKAIKKEAICTDQGNFNGTTCVNEESNCSTQEIYNVIIKEEPKCTNQEDVQRFSSNSVHNNSLITIEPTKDSYEIIPSSTENILHFTTDSVLLSPLPTNYKCLACFSPKAHWSDYCIYCDILEVHSLFPIKYYCCLRVKGDSKPRCSLKFWSYEAFDSHTKLLHPAYDYCFGCHCQVYRKQHKCKESSQDQCSCSCNELNCFKCTAFICSVCYKTFRLTEKALFREHCTKQCPRLPPPSYCVYEKKLLNKCEDCLEVCIQTEGLHPNRCAHCQEIRSKELFPLKFSCTINNCGQKFWNFFSREYHLKNEHSMEENSKDSLISSPCSCSTVDCTSCAAYICKICWCKFSILEFEKYKIHRLSHQCGVCGNGKVSLFSNDCGWQFLCSSCKTRFKKNVPKRMKSFSHNSNLNSDLTCSSNNKQKPPLKLKFRCEVCHTLFLGLDGLSRHSRFIHKSLFMCNTCGKQFADVELLRNHSHDISCACQSMECKVCAAYVCRKCCKFFRCDDQYGLKDHKCT